MIDCEDTNIDSDTSGTISKDEFLGYLMSEDILEISQSNTTRNNISDWSFMWNRVRFFSMELEAYKRTLMVDARTP